MFKLRIEPWGQVSFVQFSTQSGGIELKEEGEYLIYEMREYGRQEYVEYKFRLLKRDGYKEYARRLIEVDVAMPKLGDLIGTLSYFREVHQSALSLSRRGMLAYITFKWQDGDVLVAYSLSASKDGRKVHVQCRMTAELAGEYIDFLHGESTADAESSLEIHTRRAVGLYMLFKEYTQKGKA
jgi:hypothetical protein